MKDVILKFCFLDYAFSSGLLEPNGALGFLWQVLKGYTAI